MKKQAMLLPFFVAATVAGCLAWGGTFGPNDETDSSVDHPEAADLVAGAATNGRDRLLGVISGAQHRSTLVTVDARTGAVLRRLLQLDPRDEFLAMTRDRNHHRLYVLGYKNHDLYSIDVPTLKVKHHGNLRIDHGMNTIIRAESLAYDPGSNTLFTAIQYKPWPDPGAVWTELATIDPGTAQLSVVGRIDDVRVRGLLYSERDRTLYGVALYDTTIPGETCKIIRIDPRTATSEIVFSTPYSSIAGFALKPPSSFITWVPEGDFYAESSLTDQSFSPFAEIHTSDVVIAAVYEDFALKDILPTRKPRPVVFTYEGVVESVSDPQDVLQGRVTPGQRFTGELKYDASAPWHKHQPNGHPPHGLSFHLGDIDYAIEGLQAGVRNNYYNSADRTVKDTFGLYAVTPGQVRAFWSLEDPSARALGRNDMLPTQFNLPDWSTNRFQIFPLDSSGLKLYSIEGRVDRITRQRQ